MEDFLADKPTIHLPSGPEGGGFVTVPFADISVTAEYTAGKVELILILNRAWLADEDLAFEARGWRSPGQVAASLKYPVEDASLRRSVSQINRTFREAVASVAPALKTPQLITTKRQIGFRLKWLLEVGYPRMDTS